MSTQMLTSLRGNAVPEPSHPDSAIRNSPLLFTVSARADRIRLYHMFTDAEYMEAWLCLPSQGRAASVVVTSSDTGFQFVHRPDGGTACEVSARYRIRRRGKLLISWERTDARGSLSSVVSLKLYGDFARTTLCLAHFGLDDKTERRWHQNFWQNSLKKLCALF